MDLGIVSVEQACRNGQLGGVIEGLTHGVVVQSLAAGAIAANSAACTLLGLTMSQLLGRASADPRWRAVHEDGSDWPGEAHPSMVALTTGQRVSDVVMGVHRPDGTLVWLSVSSQLLAETHHGLPCTVTSFADITEHRLLTDALRRQRAEYRLLAEESNDLITRHLPDGRLTWVSPSCAAMLGYRTEELIGTEPTAYCHPDDVGLLLRAVGPVVETGAAASVTFRAVRTDGTVRWLESRGKGRTDPFTGAVEELLFTSRDVTERVEAEGALSASEALLRTSVEVLQDGFVRLRAVRDETGAIADFEVTLANDAAQRILAPLGLRPHPGLRLRAATAAATVDSLFDLYCEVIASGQAHTQLIDFTGHHGPILELGAVTAGDGVVLTIRDVTNLRAAEQARRDAESRFHAAFDDAPIGMALLDLDGRVVSANVALHRMLGHPDGQLLGRMELDLTEPADRAASRRAMAAMIAGAAEKAAVEKRYTTAAGSEIWAEVHATVLRDDAGRPQLFVAHVADITVRHAQEHQLRYLAERDPLTGLLNRRAFQAATHPHLGGSASQPAAVLLIDLDGFKAVNDEHGHAAGDEALVATAAILTGAARRSDLVARLGGDEFAILLPRAGVAAARRIAERIRRDVAALDVVHSGGQLTASIGIAVTGGTTDTEAALRAADQAMYEAKHDGRDRWALAPPLP